MGLADFLLREVLGQLGRRLEERLSRAAWLARHSAQAQEDLEVPFGYSLAFDRCVQAVEALEPATLEANREAGIIVAECPGSWKTFGREIEVNVRGAWDGRVVVTISSRMVPPALYGWGRTKREVTAIRASILGD